MKISYVFKILTIFVVIQVALSACLTGSTEPIATHCEIDSVCYQRGSDTDTTNANCRCDPAASPSVDASYINANGKYTCKLLSSPTNVYDRSANGSVFLQCDTGYCIDDSSGISCTRSSSKIVASNATSKSLCLTECGSTGECWDPNSFICTSTPSTTNQAVNVDKQECVCKTTYCRKTGVCELRSATRVADTDGGTCSVTDGSCDNSGHCWDTSTFLCAARSSTKVADVDKLACSSVSGDCNTTGHCWDSIFLCAARSATKVADVNKQACSTVNGDCNNTGHCWDSTFLCAARSSSKVADADKQACSSVSGDCNTCVYCRYETF